MRVVHCKKEPYTHYIGRPSIQGLPPDAVLGCWCKPKACHGDVIIKLWKELQS